MNMQPVSGEMSTEVIIVGGGPVGLSMALHLDYYGIKSVLVDLEPTTRWHPKGNTINARTMELLRRLDLADKVRSLGVPPDHPFDVAYFTRFSSFEIARGRTPSSNERREERRKAGPTHQVIEPPHKCNQMYLERFLMEEAAKRSNIVLKFGHVAESFVEDDAGVTVTIRGEGDKKSAVRGSYLVGCDGPHGLVRRGLGIKYGGEATLMGVFISGLFTSVHLRIPELYSKFVGNRRAWMYVSMNPEAMVVMITLNGVDEFMMHIPTKPGEEMSMDAIVRRVKLAVGDEIEVTVLSNRQWNAGAYLVAERYQSERVFIAGDAAHLYTPTGGFGLNTGIDDTSNLSWKISAVLKGWGHPDLLKTYETERRPAALRSTGRGRKLGQTRPLITVPPVAEEDSPAGQAARDELAVSDFVVLHHFNKPEETDWLGVILGTRYDDSPLIMRQDDPPEDSQERYVPSNIPGGRAPQIWLDAGRDKGSSLHDHFGKGLTLLRFGDVDAARLVAAAQLREVPLELFDVRDPEARKLYDRDLFLVRPDGYIVWKGDALPGDVGELLDQARGARVPAPPPAETSKAPLDA